MSGNLFRLDKAPKKGFRGVILKEILAKNNKRLLLKNERLSFTNYRTIHLSTPDDKVRVTTQIVLNLVY